MCTCMIFIIGNGYCVKECGQKEGEFIKIIYKK